MATLAELRKKANTKLAKFWNRLEQKQEAYFQKHGRYFQLLITPENDVVDGLDSDFATRHPSDQKHVIDVDFAWTSKIPFNIAVHTFENEKSRGYIADVRIKLPSGGVYGRSRTLTDYRVQQQLFDENGEPAGKPTWEGVTDETYTQWEKIIEEE